MVLPGLMNAPRERRFERWTGGYTPTASGDHTLFVQNTSPYRALVDDKVVIDSARVPAAAVRHVRLSLDAKPHEVVLEQAGGNALGGGRFWRVGVARDDEIVDPNVRKPATQADAVVVAVGFDSGSETEGADREFQLPPGQDRLIQEAAAANPNTIVVVTAGGSVDVAPWIDKVRAVTIPLDARSFAYFDVGNKRWQADAGRYSVELGRSSEDIKAKADVSLPRAIATAVSE